MKVINKIKNFFELDGGYEEEYEEEVERETYSQKNQVPQEEEPKKQAKVQHKNNLVSLQSVQKNTKLIISEPRNYDDAMEIGNHLKARRAVVVNLQRLENESARRIMDFLSGVIYALGGDMQKVGVDIFLCTPDNYEVATSNNNDKNENEFTRW